MPSDPELTAEKAVEQMREATRRIREKAWMVQAMTNPVGLVEDEQVGQQA